MTARRDYRSLLERSFYLTFLIALAAAGTEECDKTMCPGPIKYYEAMGCTPIYENSGDCCAKKYDCSHVKSMSKDKCYVNGHEYSEGKKLREEDQNPCDIGCFCQKNQREVARFVCAQVDCFFGPVKPGCYMKRSPAKCCPGPEVCPEKPEDRPTCIVNGVTYYDGDYFKVESDPDLSCVCMEGYKGENVEPFCKKPNRPYCAPQFRSASDIHNNCAPVYYSTQSPQTDCNVMSRCQNSNDTVIHNHDTKSNSDESLEKDTCQFGNLKMHLGDELNQGTDYDSVCVKCVCEVPPIPTCKRLSDTECSAAQQN